VFYCFFVSKLNVCKTMYVCNVTSLVHSDTVIAVFSSLVSGLLSVHYGAF